MAAEISWNYKEIDGFYERVRALLDNLSETSLPDKYIDLNEKAPYAEIYAKARVENWQQLEDSEFAIFESAIVYKTASLFESLVSSNSVKKKELPTITIEYFAKQKIAYEGLSLAQLADLLLSKLVGDGIGNDLLGFMVT